MKTAHYFNDKTLRITEGPAPVGGQVRRVSGKREARQLAKAAGAVCWNF